MLPVIPTGFLHTQSEAMATSAVRPPHPTESTEDEDEGNHFAPWIPEHTLLVGEDLLGLSTSVLWDLVYALHLHRHHLGGLHARLSGWLPVQT